MKHQLHCLLLFLICFSANAQYPQYAKNYFLFPIKPGQKNYLSGSMGELRPNHFHGGLDVKTDQRTGLPVFASAQGYVSRIVISIKGYGNTVYIKHPNGLTTVYAHLEWYHGVLEKYVRKLVYEQQCNELDYVLMPNEIAVKKGDTIAYSGNSGSSGGPHLHWEIRDEDEKMMNPLFFTFPEIEDSQKPYINKFALRTLSTGARVEGEFGMLEFTPIKADGIYQCKFPVHAYGLIGLQLVAYDQMNGTGSRCGISKIELLVDGKITFVHDIQKIDFNENPLMNLHLDYHTNKNQGSYYQKCYISDGNTLNTYKTDKWKGKIAIYDTLTHTVSVRIYDSYRNFTILYFSIKGTPKQKTHLPIVLSKWRKNQKISSYMTIMDFENILKINATMPDSAPAYIYSRGEKKNLILQYKNQSTYTYLHDLRTFLPDSLVIGKLKKTFNYHSMLNPAIENNINLGIADVMFPQKSLHDTTYFQSSFANNILSIHDDSHPTIGYYQVILKTNGVANKDKTSIYQMTGRKGMKHAGGEWIGNNIKFKTKYFGSFGLYTDTILPQISFHKKVNQTLYFKTSDNLSGITQWYGYLNGKFIFLHFDPKFHVIFTDLPSDILELKGTFLIGVVDGAGNKNEKIFTF